MAQFIADNESSTTDSESEEANNLYHEQTSTWSKGPVTVNLTYIRDQTEKEEHIQKKSSKRGKDDTPMDTSTSAKIGRVRVKNHTPKQLQDRKPTMHNVKITPVNRGYQLKFSQFSSDVYPDTSCTETIIASSMTIRQRLSVFPINRQLRHAEGRQ
jgi:hypothetical protein